MEKGEKLLLNHTKWNNLAESGRSAMGISIELLPISQFMKLGVMGHAPLVYLYCQHNAMLLILALRRELWHLKESPTLKKSMWISISIDPKWVQWIIYNGIFFVFQFLKQLCLCLSQKKLWLDNHKTIIFLLSSYSHSLFLEKCVICKGCLKLRRKSKQWYTLTKMETYCVCSTFRGKYN